MVLWPYILKATAIPLCSMSAHDNFSISAYLLLQFQTFVALTAPLLCSRPLYWTSLYIHTVHKLHQGSLEDKLWPMLLSGPEITCSGEFWRVQRPHKKLTIQGETRPIKSGTKRCSVKHIKNVRFHTPGYCCRWVSPIIPCKDWFTCK